MIRARSAYPSLNLCVQQVTKYGKKKNINILLSFSAATNINSYRMQLSLSNVVSLIETRETCQLRHEGFNHLTLNFLLCFNAASRTYDP